jgi:hypothetical protein
VSGRAIRLTGSAGAFEHGNELHRDKCAGGHLPPVIFLDEDQVLNAVDGPHWNDHPAAEPELLDERGGDVSGGGGDDHCIEGRVLGPAEVAIAMPYHHLAISKAAKAVARGCSQRLEDLQRIHLASGRREHRCLIA